MDDDSWIDDETPVPRREIPSRSSLAIADLCIALSAFASEISHSQLNESIAAIEQLFD